MANESIQRAFERMWQHIASARGGIIDVTELPTENIVGSAIYRVTHTNDGNRVTYHAYNGDGTWTELSNNTMGEAAKSELVNAVLDSLPVAEEVSV